MIGQTATLAALRFAAVGLRGGEGLVTKPQLLLACLDALCVLIMDGPAAPDTDGS